MASKWKNEIVVIPFTPGPAGIEAACLTDINKKLEQDRLSVAQIVPFHTSQGWRLLIVVESLPAER